MENKLHQFVGNKIRPIELAVFVKKILAIKRQNYTIDGFHWNLDPVSNFGLRLLKDGCYEADTQRLILDNLKEGDVFIDLGANEGYFSILASKKVGKNGNVYCIEPQDRLWNVILTNVNKNNCHNVNLIPYAISDESKELPITLSPSINTGSSTIVKQRRRKFWKVQLLRSTTLDNLFFEKLSCIHLMKVDIEGFELFALKGGERLLKSGIIKKMIIEIHPQQLSDLGQSAAQVKDYLNNLGYSIKEGIYTFTG